MMKIEYFNIPNGSSRLNFIIRYIFNVLRTFLIINLRYPWVKYRGFIRIMKKTSFAHMNIQMGNNVQFGEYCNVANNVIFGNNILMAGRVCFIGKNDHVFSVPGQLIWHGKRGDDGYCIVENDVWIGHGCTIVGNIRISNGSIIAAGSVVTKDIPPCEIWGGVPAKKIRDRFSSNKEKIEHIDFLHKLQNI